MNNSQTYQWIDTELVPSDEATSSINRGVWYGDGCFETVLIDHGRCFRFDHHIERLSRGMDYLSISDKSEIINLIQPGIRELLKANSLANKTARVRIQVWREGSPGFAAPEQSEIRLQIIATESLTEYSPLTLATVPTRRIPNVSQRADLKLSSAANYIRAATEAKQAGADEALMQTIDGNLSETTIANLFWLHQDTVYTPSVDCDLLPGKMRNAFINWVKHEQISLRLNEGKFQPEVLFQADEIWLTNSVRMIQPVSHCDGVKFGNAYHQMQNILEDFGEFVRENYEPV